MAVSSTEISVEYAGNESAVTPYTIPFAFLSVDHIAVMVDGDDLDAGGFVVTRLSDGSGGSVVTDEAVDSESVVTIERRTPLTQPATFALHGPFPSTAAEAALDRLAMQVQEIQAGRLDNALLYVEQSLSAGQKAQTLENLGIAINGDPAGAMRYDSLQALDADELAQAQANLGLGQLYFGVFHLDGTINKLVMCRSRDGKTWERIGRTIPYVPPAGGIRDPATVYHAPSRKFVISYTKATTPVTFDTELGLAVTSDGISATHAQDIVLGGISPSYTWNGSIFFDGTDYYFFLLPLAGGGNKNTHGVGWIKVENPEDDPADWTFTDFVSLKATNSNWSAATDLNDPKVIAVTGGWRIFMDGDNGTDDPAILTAFSSTSPVTGYSALEPVPGHDAREGAIIVETEGGWLLFSEVIYGPVCWSFTEDFESYTTPAEVNWNETVVLCNGDVVPCFLDEQALVNAAPGNKVGVVDSGDYGNSAIRIEGTTLTWKLNCDPDGNGNTTGARDVFAIVTTGVGTANQFAYIYGSFIASTTVQGAALLGTTSVTSNGRIDAGTYFNSTAATNQIHYYFVTGSASHPALKPVGATLQIRLGDDSGFAAIQTLYQRFGSGTPEGAITAPVGATYSRTDGGAGTSFYVKESGSGNTGWVAK